jgi:gliding motility-associated-like protein
VHYLPVLNFGLPAICLPEGKGQFTDSSTIADGTQNLFSYAWNFADPNDPTPATIPNPVHKYSALGPYNVQLKVTSKDGCIDSLTKQLTTVYPQPKAGFNIDSAEICMGNSIHFSDASVGYTGSIISWHWDLAEGIISSLQNPSRKFSDSGSYKISLFIVDVKGCNSDTSVNTVVIDPYPHLSLIHKLFILQNGSAQMKPDFYANNPTFNWSPALYLDTATIAYPVTSPLTDITYKFTLTGQGNCSVSDTVFVKVLLAPEVPNVFTPNGDGINDNWVIKYLESYPNCIVQVFDRGGQKVFKSIGYTNTWDGTNNGKPLPVGTYYYIINPKNGRSLISGSVTIIR